ncbi:hypothetical protein OUZ56_021318 [Daphnia magna]|uniref:Uncharacterized protein n=1 Tax=Daphnia magna TaxID=35525 RepID=A0ABQ9ZH07_9CRUS|nr:hypothetical protein OUZ56_021318 [Daphnia magna]
MNEIKVFSGRDGKVGERLATGDAQFAQVNGAVKRRRNFSGCHFFRVHTVTDVLITLAPGLYQQNKE